MPSWASLSGTTRCSSQPQPQQQQHPQQQQQQQCRSLLLQRLQAPAQAMCSSQGTGAWGTTRTPHQQAWLAVVQQQQQQHRQQQQGWGVSLQVPVYTAAHTLLLLGVLVVMMRGGVVLRRLVRR
jgi:hypothetical protein